jgi:hypothetical protein
LKKEEAENLRLEKDNHKQKNKQNKANERTEKRTKGMQKNQREKKKKSAITNKAEIKSDDETKLQHD